MASRRIGPARVIIDDSLLLQELLVGLDVEAPHRALHHHLLVLPGLPGRYVARP